MDLFFVVVVLEWCAESIGGGKIHGEEEEEEEKWQRFTPNGKWKKWKKKKRQTRRGGKICEKNTGGEELKKKEETYIHSIM